MDCQHAGDEGASKSDENAIPDVVRVEMAPLRHKIERQDETPEDCNFEPIHLAFRQDPESVFLDQDGQTQRKIAADDDDDDDFDVNR